MKINNIKLIGSVSTNNQKLIFSNESQTKKLEKIARKYKKTILIAQKGEDLLLVNSGFKTAAIRISEMNDLNSIYSSIVANLYENSQNIK